jgi:hypothetical protein
MKILPFILVSLLLLSSCLENSPDFLEAQPTDSKNLKKFPRKLHGNFKVDDDEVLTISKFMILQTGLENIEISLMEIDTNEALFIKNDTLFDSEEGDKIPIKILHDTAFGIYDWIDTAFHISDKNILRKFKGQFFLNEKQDDNLWKVVKLRLIKSDGSIEFATIHAKNEAEEVKNITPLIDIEAKNDTINHYKLKPTKKELRLLIQSTNTFTDKEVYKRID